MDSLITMKAQLENLFEGNTILMIQGLVPGKEKVKYLLRITWKG